MNIITELNAQAEKVCKELVAAKRAAKEARAAKSSTQAMYHKGRAEELEKWLASLESMITKIIESREGRK